MPRTFSVTAVTENLEYVEHRPVCSIEEVTRLILKMIPELEAQGYPAPVIQIRERYLERPGA